MTQDRALRPLAISRSAVTSRRRGFTLVEVLLALGLTMLLLAAAYSGLALFQRVTVTGRDDAERSQIARAIERRMSADVRCVLFKEPSPEDENPTSPTGAASVDPNQPAAQDTNAGGSSSSPSTDTSGSTNDQPASTATPADAYASQSMGVYGDATTLVLHVAKPSRETATSLETAATKDADGNAIVPRKSDLRSISYFLAVPGGGGLQGAVGNIASGGSALMSRGQGVQGLARLDGDRLALQQADANGQTDLLAQQATVLAKEVTQLEFRYYDGVAWQTSWDTSATGALPRAIEVTMRIEADTNPKPKRPSSTAPKIVRASDLYRFVIALPLSDPTLGMEQL